MLSRILFEVLVSCDIIGHFVVIVLFLDFGEFRLLFPWAIGLKELIDGRFDIDVLCLCRRSSVIGRLARCKA